MRGVFLVTGGCGFIGRHLVSFLASEGREVHFVGRQECRVTGAKYWCGDLTIAQQVDYLIDKIRPTTIFHLAANTKIPPNGESRCRLLFDNLVATQHLLESCEQGTRFVYASSATVYGDSWPLCSPTSVYGFTKLASEILTGVYARKVSRISCRLVANVGEGATHGLLLDLVRKIKEGTPNGPLHLIGVEPGSRKPYMHVEDTVRALYELSRTQHTGNVDISVPGYLTVKDIAEVALSMMEESRQIVWHPEDVWDGDNEFVQTDPFLLRELGFVATYHTSRSAIKRAIEDTIR